MTLVEAVHEDGKNTHRTLLRLGEVTELRASGPARPHHQGAAHLRRGELVEAGELVGEGGPELRWVAAAWSFFRRLGLEEHFAASGEGRRPGSLRHVVFVMLANRLTDPTSKRRTINEWLASVALRRRGRCPEPRPVLPGDRRPRRAQGGDRGAPLLRALQLHEPGPAPGLLRPDLQLLRDGRRRAAELSLPRLRLQPGPPSDRPQVMIGLLVTSDGIPIAHHVFSGNTADVSTLPGVMEDLRHASASAASPLSPTGASSQRTTSPWSTPTASTTCWPRGFTTTRTWQPCWNRRTRPDHAPGWRSPRRAASVPRSPMTPGALSWCSRPCATCGTVHRHLSSVRPHRGRPHRHRGKSAVGQARRPGQDRRRGRPGPSSSRVGRCFVTTIRKGFFSWDFDEKARRYDEELLCGRFVITTSLDDLRGLCRTGAALLQELCRTSNVASG